MFQTTINLTTKPEGYKEALEAYISRHKATGMQVEFGLPNLQPYKEPKRRLWRLGQVNPANVCAVLKEPVYNATAGTYTFVAHFHGGRNDALERYRDKVTLSARMLKDKDGKVIEIMQLDFITTDGHVDITHEEPTKAKRKR
ncbi:hypothetical protein D3C81_379260 [compost metagenome]